MQQQNLLKIALEVTASGLIFVVVSALLFWPLEQLLEGNKAARPTLKDLAYLWFYQSYGLWIGAGIVFELAFLLRGLLPHSWTLFVKGQPFWLQATAALLMAEIWVYVAHRAAHRWAFLWKFHKVHHSIEEMTWSASSRQHPVDFLLIIVGANLPAMILGIDLRSVALFIILERLYTVMLHSNLRLDWGWFSKVVASPNLHKLHHDPSVRGKNYAGILSFIDVLGNTYQSAQVIARPTKILYSADSKATD
jgi:sterol desaturase/sphingolipid hydroxylase (fatty acid hydroxylase superfamily)